MSTTPLPADATTSTLRTRLLAASVVVLGLAFVQDPGYLIPDTKFDLAAAPLDFLGRALHLWNDEATFGLLQNQAYGYLWPMGPFFAMGDVLGMPGWVVQRLWIGMVMVVALTGAALVARSLGVRSDLACLVAGFAFALSPRMLTTLGPISIEAWPSALAPWVLLPLVLGARSGSPRRAAALSALAIACVGGVNAAATFAVIPLGAVWLLTREPGPRRRALMLWWPAFTLLGTLWWLVPLFVMGAYSPPFLDYIESTAVTTFPTTPFDVLRGTSNWVPYVTSASRAGNDLLTTPYLVLNSGVVLLLGVAGLVDRRTPHRAFLGLSVVVGVLMVSAGHQGAVEGWFAGDVRALLDAALAPLRNVHKFDVVVRLPLVLGIAFLLDRVVRQGPTGVRSHPGDRASVLLGRANQVAVVAMTVVAVTGSVAPILLGRLAPAGATLGVPDYWSEAAAWIDERDAAGTSLLVPGAPFADYLWGAPRDEPLQYLADSPWAVRDVIPLTPPGTIRMLDRVEAQLAQGSGSTALTDYLARAGVDHLVVRNDLARGSDVPDPVLVHQALADSPGITKVAEFGPDLGGSAMLETEDEDERLVVNGGWQSTYPAVEIFAVSGESAPVVAAEDPPVVAGGPEDLYDLLRLGLLAEAATVLAHHLPSDTEPGRGSAGSLILTDGLRERERGFARIHDGASAALTPGDVRRSGNPTRDYLDSDADRWMTTVRLTGAESISASSSASDSGAAGGARRGRLPFAAVDGDDDTQWVADALRPEPAWWKLDFDAPRSTATVRLVGGVAAAENQVVRVRTDAGATGEVRLGPGQIRSVVLPVGATSTIRVEEVSERGADPLAIAEVGVAGVEVRRRLVLPELPPEWEDPAAIVLRRDLDRRRGCVVVEGDVRCVAGREREDEEATGLGRIFTTGDRARWSADLTLVPQGGTALDALALRNQPVSALASSAGVSDPRASALATVDGRPGTTWLADADDVRPSLTLSWLGERTVRRIELAVDEDAAARVPTRVLLSWPGGSQEVALRDGSAAVVPFRSDQVRVTVTQSDDTRSLDYDAAALDLGVGISEIDLVGVEYLPLTLTADVVRYPCGSGPDILVDGRRIATAVVASPRALAQGEVVDGRTCGGSRIELGTGEHIIDVPNAPGIGVDALVLRRVESPVGGDVTPLPWRRSPATRETTPPASSDVLAWRQNANDGWVARRGDDVLQPTVIDGWQQGWEVQGARRGEPVVATFTPDGFYRAGLLAGLLSLVALLGAALLLGRRGGRWPAALDGRRVPTTLLLVTALAAGGVLGGTLGVAVTAAVCVAALAVWRAPFPAIGRYREIIPWLAAVPCLVVAAAYAVTPWGSSGGWAGDSAWVGYLALVPVAALVLSAREPRRADGSSTSRRPRWAGRSTRR